MEHHNPDIYGTISAAGSPGTLNQKLYSNGPAAQVTYGNGSVNAAWVNNTLTVTVDNASDNEVLNLISADANNLAVAGTDGRVFVSGATVPNVFTFTSPSSVSHVINHNLGNQFPVLMVAITPANEEVVPSTVVFNSANQLTITFFVARAIAGTVIG